MDSRSLMKFRKILNAEKQRVLEQSKSIISREMEISPDDLPDETDLAAFEVSQNLVFKLRDRERQLLSKIEAAIKRLDDGSFGICQDCEENIEFKRLEARPVSTLCIHCKEREEHREKIYA